MPAQRRTMAPSSGLEVIETPHSGRPLRLS